MENISFNEDSSGNSAQVLGQRGMAGWMIRNKFAKNEKEANLILMGIAGIGIAFALFLVFSGSGDTTLDAQERERLERSTTPQPSL